MLFNSYEFILFFLPVVFTIFRALTQRQLYSRALQWLIASSLFFYSWQNPRYLLLLVSSVLFNFAISRLIVNRPSPAWQKSWLFVGVAGNLLPLAYFKYAHFVLQNIQLAGFTPALSLPDFALPLAISFFTFQQIAFLANARRTGTAQHSFQEYVFCVVFFPHLIAGPLIYYREFLDQLNAGRQRELVTDNIVRGALLFVLGLAKKVLLGDNLGIIIKPVFDDLGGPSGAFDAWMGSILFGFQIYFDFSAYSDMAIGLACLFGLHLPINFDSPYQSVTYREFWRRWHVTLFRFFRDHVYLPLLGNSTSSLRRFILTFLVFFLSGLWHGAAWTFVAWGLANWALVVINDLWLMLPGMTALLTRLPTNVKVFSGRLFVFICMSWTFMLFRSPDFTRVGTFLKQAFSASGMDSSVIISTFETTTAFSALHQLLAIDSVPCLLSLSAGLLVLVWFFPNAVRLMLAHEKDYQLPEECMRFHYTTSWCILLGLLLWAAMLGLPAATKFIYFQF